MKQPQMKEMKDMNLRKRNNTTMPVAEQWYDVQDENGVWRVGFCQKKQATYKLISMDGFHPSYASFYCEHAGKILPVRSKTMGLTVPEQKTIRKVFRLKQIEQVCGKMSLFQLISNQLENTPEKIRLFVRTQLLIFIDKVFNTPFEILANIKMIDVHINKLFMYTIQYYFKLLQSSKRFVSLLDSNQTAKELFKATYQMAHIIQMILGVHKRSRAFYEASNNRTIKCEGIMDYFIKYEGGGILPFKLFFKNVSALKTVDHEDLVICLQTVYLFVSLCEKYQNDLIQGKNQNLTRIILDEIITCIKNFCQKNKQLLGEFKNKFEIVSRIETLYFKLFNTECSLRKFLQSDPDRGKSILESLAIQKPITRMKSEWQLKKSFKVNEKEKQQISEGKVKELEDKIAKLQESMNKMHEISLHGQSVKVEGKELAQEPQPTENLGEEAFLGSLEWALEAGDVQTVKKLVKWRKSLLKLGRITGWQIALAVGMKTFRSKQIQAQDIIDANYSFISKKAGIQLE